MEPTSRFLTIVEEMIGNVRQLIDASSLLRSRVMQTDELLDVIEAQQRALAERIDEIEQRLAKVEGAIGDFPSSIP